MDRYSRDKRSEVMSKIKANGSKIENRFFACLEKAGISPVVFHNKQILGVPDVTHEPGKVAIFIDSCFWHGCKQHCRMPKTNQDYWSRKIAKNIKRDRKIKKELAATGWLVIRVWEHSLKQERTLRWWITRIKNLILNQEKQI